jgi:hypothetical protein
MNREFSIANSIAWEKSDIVPCRCYAICPYCGSCLVTAYSKDNSDDSIGMITNSTIEVSLRHCWNCGGSYQTIGIITKVIDNE